MDARPAQRGDCKDKLTQYGSGTRGSFPELSLITERNPTKLKEVIMSSLSFHSKGRDRWVQPQGISDASIRRQIFGKIQPMEEPTFFQRLFRSR